MIKTAYIWENIVMGTRQLEVLMSDGYKVVSSTLYESEDGDLTNLVFAAVLVKEER